MVILTGDHYMGKPSATGQPTRPTQPFILSIKLVYRTCAWWRHLVNAYGVISLVRLIAAA